jgi:lipoate-protein ligase A
VALQIVSEAFPEGDGMDVAVNHAILDAVAGGEMPETFRIYVPSPVLAFGGADRVHPGYAQAVKVARAHGFAPVERLAGGRAAVFHEMTLAFSWTTADPDPRSGITDRFREIAGVMARAFQALGVDARIGEIPGEYCPGAWSVNLAGRIKVMGVGQRLVRGASHVGGVVVVDDGERIRDVLIPIYRSLHIDWDPRTAGALADMAPGLTMERSRSAIVDQLSAISGVVDGSIPQTVIESARGLVGHHLPKVA